MTVNFRAYDNNAVFRDFDEYKLGNIKTNNNLRLQSNMQFKSQPQKDEYVKDGQDDGYISFGQKLKNFGKGIISPVTSMFSSVGNFVTGAAMIAGTAGLIAAFPPLAPVFVTAGIGVGAYNLVKGGYKAMTAQTDKEAAQAWQSMGFGTTSLGLSAWGAKSALNKAGIMSAEETAKIGVFKASWQCIKNSPKMLWESGKLLFHPSQIAANLGFRKTKTETTEIKDQKQLTEKEKLQLEQDAAEALENQLENNYAGKQQAAQSDTSTVKNPTQADLEKITGKKLKSNPARQKPVVEDVAKTHTETMKKGLTSGEQPKDIADIIRKNNAKLSEQTQPAHQSAQPQKVEYAKFTEDELTVSQGLESKLDIVKEKSVKPAKVEINITDEDGISALHAPEIKNVSLKKTPEQIAAKAHRFEVKQELQRIKANNESISPYKSAAESAKVFEQSAAEIRNAARKSGLNADIQNALGEDFMQEVIHRTGAADLSTPDTIRNINILKRLGADNIRTIAKSDYGRGLLQDVMTTPWTKANAGYFQGIENVLNQIANGTFS